MYWYFAENFSKGVCVMENDIYEKSIIVEADHVNAMGKMKTSAFFSALQDISDEHIALHGAGYNDMLEQGLLWIIANQRAEIARMPRLGEVLTIRTWTGRNKHVFLPRYYTVWIGSEMISKAAICWTFMYSESRELVGAEDCPVHIRTNIEEMKPFELNPLSGPKPVKIESSESFESGSSGGFCVPGNPGTSDESKQVTLINTSECANLTDSTSKAAINHIKEKSVEFTVPHEYIDRNGHMNNSFYFDIADKLIEAGREPSSIIARYTSEAMEGDLLKASCANLGERYYITINSDRGSHFKLEMTVKPSE